MKTRVKVEHFLGDVIKIVACQLEDLLELDQLQMAEINSIVRARILSLPDKTKSKSNRRPRPNSVFMKNYNSGNHYTLTKSKKENSTKDRLDVISACFLQVEEYDGLTKNEFISLCVSYVSEHFTDGVDLE